MLRLRWELGHAAGFAVFLAVFLLLVTATVRDANR